MIPEAEMPMLVLLLLLLSTAPALAQQPIEYDVRFDNAVHHEASIEATFTGLPAEPLELRMSRTSPGRYALHEFAKNVYDVRARGAGGESLPIERTTPHQWTVRGHEGRVTVEYTLHADHADGTYPGIDRSHAHLNMPATFLWARGLEDRPIRVTFHPPAGADWKAATQLRPADAPMTFTAPDRAYFMDSPTELSDFVTREWTVGSNGRTQTIRLAVHHDGDPADVDRYAEMARRVVREQLEVFGELPAFDHGRYTFIADYLPWVHGDGMEHRNSTILTSTRPLATHALRNLGTLSHEFFHAWNMERLRSHELEPFDFERENQSDDLWFGEGFTSYYDDLTIARAGLVDLDDYAAGLGRTLNTVINSPGRRFHSPVEMSRQAPFVDWASWIDRTNHANTFISYYTWGSAVALGLDLLLRTRFEGLTLDDYMRAVWARHGRSEEPYTRDDLRRTLAELTGDRAFADRFFARYVEGREVPDYERLLARAGLLLRTAEPGAAVIGRARIDAGDGAGTIAEPTRIGSPLYEAGLDRGDRILRLDGTSIETPNDIEAILSAYAPGDTIMITYEQRGRTETASLTLAEDPRLEVVPYEHADRPLTEAIRAFRARWLDIESAGTQAS